MRIDKLNMVFAALAAFSAMCFVGTGILAYMLRADPQFVTFHRQCAALKNTMLEEGADVIKWMNWTIQDCGQDMLALTDPDAIREKYSEGVAENIINSSSIEACIEDIEFLPKVIKGNSDRIDAAHNRAKTLGCP